MNTTRAHAPLLARAAPGVHTAAAIAVGVGIFLVSTLLPGPALLRVELDTIIFEQYGEAIVAGSVPYRDFFVEYPPGSLPAFVIPALVPADFGMSFKLFQLLCAEVAIAFVATTLAALGVGRRRLYLGAAFAALVPLLLGPVTLLRFDLWPAALMAAALFFLVSGRPRAGFALLAVATTAKLYPGVLLPLALLFVWRHRGRRDAVVGAAVFAAVAAVVVVPFVALAPSEFRYSLEYQTNRSLQIESLGASVLLAAHQLGRYSPAIWPGWGSHNLDGELPYTVGTVQAVVQLLVVAAVWLLFARGRRRERDLVLAAAAAVAAVVVLGKVISPQFMLWLLPLIPLVGGRIGVAASGLFAGALVLTHSWYPSRYYGIVALEALPTWLVVARNAVLLALAALLVAGLVAAQRKQRDVSGSF